MNAWPISAQALSLVFIALLIVALHGAAAGAASAERDKIVEAAKKEARLVLYTGMESEEANLFTREFAKRYPFIKPEIFRSSGEKVQTRFLLEHRANVYNADVFQASIVQVYQLKNAGLLMKHVSAESPAYGEGFKDAQGFWTAFYVIPYVIGYNTRLVPPAEAPASYEDLLQLRWKGQIALESEEYQWFYHVLQIMGRENGLQYMKRLAGQNLQMRSGHTLLAQLVAAGEVAIATVLYSSRVERMKNSGAPIDWVRFKGPTLAAINAVSIAEKAPHPNAAKLFVDFILSREGQTLLRGLRRVPARSDVAPDPPQLTQGLNLYAARPEGMIENYNDTVARFNEIFLKSR